MSTNIYVGDRFRMLTPPRSVTERRLRLMTPAAPQPQPAPQQRG